MVQQLALGQYLVWIFFIDLAHLRVFVLHGVSHGLASDVIGGVVVVAELVAAAFGEATVALGQVVGVTVVRRPASIRINIGIL